MGLHLCNVGWDLYMKWDTISKAYEQPDLNNRYSTDEEVTAENQAWTALQDHKNSCKECRKDEG